MQSNCHSSNCPRKLLDNVMVCLVGRINDCRAVLGMEKIDIKKGIRE
jgi:hypothetical protein